MANDVIPVELNGKEQPLEETQEEGPGSVKGLVLLKIQSLQIWLFLFFK